MMLAATLLGIIFTSAGLALSYEPDLPAGATIILLAGLAYLLSALGRGIWLRWRRNTAMPETKP
jgi:zinc transport system permease protein